MVRGQYWISLASPWRVVLHCQWGSKQRRLIRLASSWTAAGVDRVEDLYQPDENGWSLMRLQQHRDRAAQRARDAGVPGMQVNSVVIVIVESWTRLFAGDLSQLHLSQLRHRSPGTFDPCVAGFDRFEFKFRPKRSDFGRKKLRTRLPASSATKSLLTAPRSGHLDRLGRSNGARGGGHDHPTPVF